MPKTALITGVTGQDGAYLAKLLLDEGYDVYGAQRRSSSHNAWRLNELGIEDRVKYVAFELLEFGNILNALRAVKPDEIYNLAAQSFVAVSFDQPLYTGDVDALGVARLLEAARIGCPEAKIYQASTSEMFGKVQAVPQDESTPFYPRSPYAAAKLYAHWMCVNYREAHGTFAVSGILFNHESPLRGREFVTRKITSNLALIKHGKAEVLELGNLDAKRDWGFAGDYVAGMHKMLQHDVPQDYVLATGRTHTVREFVAHAAGAAGFDLQWEGEAETTVGRDAKSGKVVVKVNPQFYRPAEVDLLIGDAGKARDTLGWTPAVSYETLAVMMAEADLNRVAAGQMLF